MRNEHNETTINTTVLDIRKDFKEQLKVLVPSLLSPENLLVKRIGGSIINSGDLLQYLKSYIEIFKNGSVPPPLSMFQVIKKTNSDF